MGFDISGLQPVINTEKPSILDKDVWKIEDEKLKEKWFEANNKWNEENPGIYFRNNCWWWRPLWDYVAKVCEGVLTEKDVSSGHYNDGKEISATKVAKMVKKLKKDIEQKKHELYEKGYKEYQAKLEKENCSCCEGDGMMPNKGSNGIEVLQDALNKKLINEVECQEEKSLMKECHVCKGTGLRENWGKSYPFSSENVEEFVKFLEQSGGIAIY